MLPSIRPETRRPSNENAAMSRTVKLALAATSVGFVTAGITVVHFTPLSMTAFFLLGLPGFALGFLLYAFAVVAELRHKRVL